MRVNEIRPGVTIVEREDGESIQDIVSSVLNLTSQKSAEKSTTFNLQDHLVPLDEDHDCFSPMHFVLHRTLLDFLKANTEPIRGLLALLTAAADIMSIVRNEEGFEEVLEQMTMFLAENAVAIRQGRRKSGENLGGPEPEGSAE